jgi:hypothetical protein
VAHTACTATIRNGKQILGRKSDEKSTDLVTGGGFHMERKFNTLRTGDADLRFLHYNCARRMTQICVFNTRLFSLYNTLNYAIHRDCL